MSTARQRVIQEAIDDVNALRTPYSAAVLPAVVSAATTSASLGGLLQRLFGYSYDAREQAYMYQPVDYPITSSATSGVRTNSTINVTQDSDFVCAKITECSGVDGAGTNDVSVQMIFSNSDRQLTSNANGIIATAINGTGQRPYILTKPWLVARNSRITVIVTSLSANARSIFLDLHGYKVLDVSALDLTTRR